MRSKRTAADMLLVVFQMDDRPKGAPFRQTPAKVARDFSRVPRMHDVRVATVAKSSRVLKDAGEIGNLVGIRTKPLGVTGQAGHGNNAVASGIGKRPGNPIHVTGAVAAQIMIENKQNIHSGSAPSRNA